MPKSKLEQRATRPSPYQLQVIWRMAEGRALWSWALDSRGKVARLTSLSGTAYGQNVPMRTVRVLLREGYLFVYFVISNGARTNYALTPKGIMAVADELRRQGKA